VAVPPDDTVALLDPPLARLRLTSDTTSDSTELVTAEKFESPPYTAVIECVAAVRLDVAYVATPESSVPEPSRVVPS
jgi:hypothetical protein